MTPAEAEKLVEALLDTWDDAYDGEPDNGGRVAKYYAARAALLAALTEGERHYVESSDTGQLFIPLHMSRALKSGDKVRVWKVTP